MAEFKRVESQYGSVPQKFFDGMFPLCPLCGTSNPQWAIQLKSGALASVTLAKCDKCGAVLSVATGETSGKDNSLFSLGSFLKSVSGKNKSTIYVQIMEVGSAQVTQLNKYKEFTLEELREMAESLGCPKQSSEETS